MVINVCFFQTTSEELEAILQELMMTWTLVSLDPNIFLHPLMLIPEITVRLQTSPSITTSLLCVGVSSFRVIMRMLSDCCLFF